MNAANLVKNSKSINHCSSCLVMLLPIIDLIINQCSKFIISIFNETETRLSH